MVCYVLLVTLLIGHVSFEGFSPKNMEYKKVQNSSKDPGSHNGYFDLYKRIYPHATRPWDNDTSIYITSVTENAPNLWTWLPEGDKAFTPCKNLQPWMKCEYYADKFNQAIIRQSHAVLFHALYMRHSRKQFKGLLEYRRTDQKWIFFETEAPTNMWNFANASSHFWQLFNLTSTFTSDSNIPLNHHKLICVPKENLKPSGINYMANKTKMAAWFVSHCNTASKREVYVEELQKYIDVDIFGKCGNETICHKSMEMGRRSRCMRELITNNYKFYLSFENSFCSEYVTEKLHRTILKHEVIPVVLGGSDYKNILPRGSFINAMDFNSVKSLALHLKKVAGDSHLYNEYIENKKTVDCSIPWSLPCSLCEYLHNHHYEKQVVYNAASFWSVGRRCTSPIDVYKVIAPEIVTKIHFGKMADMYL